MADKVYTQTMVPDNQTMLSTQVEQSSLMTISTRGVSSVPDITSISITSQYVSNTSNLISSADFTSVFVTSASGSSIIVTTIATQLQSSLSLSISTPIISKTSTLVSETSVSVQDPSVGIGTSSLLSSALDSSEKVSAYSSFSSDSALPIAIETTSSVSSIPYLATETITSYVLSAYSWITQQSGSASFIETSSTVLRDEITTIYLPSKLETIDNIRSTPSVSESFYSTLKATESGSVETIDNIRSTPSVSESFYSTLKATESGSVETIDNIRSTPSVSESFYSTLKATETGSVETIDNIRSTPSVSESFFSTLKATESGSVDNIDSITKVQTSLPILTSEFTAQLPTTNLFITRTVSTLGTDKNFTNTLDSVFSNYQSTLELPSSTMSLQSYGNSVFNNLTSDTPDRTTDILFSTSTDNELFTELTSYTSYSLSLSTTRAVIPAVSSYPSSMDLSSSGLVSSDFLTPSNTVTTPGATSSYIELISSSNEKYITSFADLPSNQMTLSTNTVLSSFSSIYDLPVISTRTSRSSHQGTLLYSSDQVLSTFSSEISETSSLDGIQSTFSRLDTLRQTTPEFSGVTSAFDKMSTSTTVSQVNQQIGDLRREIADYEDKVNSYVIAVVVLVLFIVLLLTLIGLYILRRRRYYEKKQLRMRGIDVDLMGEDETKMRAHKTYFKTDQSDGLRISGRISTASLGSGGESEPLHLLESFNKSKNKSLEPTEENNDGKLAVDKIKDEEF